MTVSSASHTVFDTFPWPGQTSAPQRGARTAPPAPTLCDPSRVVSGSSVDSGGIAGAQPPATVSHPSGMLPRDIIVKNGTVAAAARELRRVRYTVFVRPLRTLWPASWD
jgi:hypothetical protein